MPLLFLPAKETVEVLFLKGKRKMTSKENIKCTLALVFISYIFAIFVPSIGDAMALAGCTTNPMVIKELKPLTNPFILDRIHHSSYALLENSQKETNFIKRKNAQWLRCNYHNNNFNTRSRKFCILEAIRLILKINKIVSINIVVKILYLHY